MTLEDRELEMLGFFLRPVQSNSVFRDKTKQKQNRDKEIKASDLIFHGTLPANARNRRLIDRNHSGSASISSIPMTAWTAFKQFNSAEL